jgi:uncharacterized protein (TIGR03084 family)
MPDMQAICGDLAAEHEALDTLVGPLDDRGWDVLTPAEGWTVRDQIGHLAFFDEMAAEAATRPEAFRASLAQAGPETLVRRHLDRGRAMTGAAVLDWWRAVRAAMLAALARVDPKSRLAWYGPGMSALSFATARLMETWAHGQDVADALGRRRPATDRLRHVAHMGVLARPFSYTNRGREAPARPVRVELTGPSGDVWAWGDSEAADVVRGSAEDFCLVVTRRRHPADTDLRVEGPLAAEWISIAQAFAGPPGPGRAKGQFPMRSR